MKHFYFLFSFLLTIDFAHAQVNLNPTVTPSIFRASDEITVTYDVTGTTLASLTNAYIWVWIPGENIDAKYNINPASNNTAQTNFAKFTKTTDGGRTLFSLTFKPADFFASDIAGAQTMGMLLKGNDWSNGQTTDFVTDFWDGAYTLRLNAPTLFPLFVAQGDEIEINAEVPVASAFKLYLGETLIDESAGSTTYEYTYDVTQNTGFGVLRLVANAGESSAEQEFTFLISAPSPSVARPEGVIAGINYGEDATKVTLCLWAPGKSSAYVRGDFSDWEVQPSNLMNRDGEFFWIELSGLTSGTEYGFQYLVDEELFLADPYADKILDPDDQYIPATVYPDLKAYPQKALQTKWYFNRVSVFQTNQIPYQWKTVNYERPRKENLVIYEVLIRDFFGPNAKTYASLTDTLEYFKRLGVNAIELMPIMEFNGNESWGYNPAFMFAPDKFYGPKNRLKEFVDKCHAAGIAVILDIAMNHQDLPNPYVLMDFDFNTGKPKATNKWFNTDAKHPFNVFFDMNHESEYTKAYLDTVNHYWLNEYRVDGFRFDLSKGFTQQNNPNDVGAWSAYDASRIALLKRMSDKIWEHSPEAYVILEHLSVNQEEKELAEYRADEGKGMMLWGNLNNAYSQLTMGYESSNDITGTSHQARSWNVPHLVSYMESHDEERLAYRNKNFGAALGPYSTKNPETSMDRIKAASVIFYSIPGPKMLWQFGELGYDYSINTCDDGSVNENCRVSPKPLVWNYINEDERAGLFIQTSDLIRLHTTYPVFTDGTATISGGSSLIKQVQVKNSPYTVTPASTAQMNVTAVANFGLSNSTASVNFPHTGTWYDYYNGGAAISVSSLPHSLPLERGEYRLFTDVQIGAGPVTAIPETLVAGAYPYPNPTNGRVTLEDHTKQVRVLDARGQQCSFHRDGNTIDLGDLPAGMYLVVRQGINGRRAVSRVVKY